MDSIKHSPRTSECQHSQRQQRPSRSSVACRVAQGCRRAHDLGGTSGRGHRRPDHRSRRSWSWWSPHSGTRSIYSDTTWVVHSVWSLRLRPASSEGPFVHLERGEWVERKGLVKEFYDWCVRLRWRIFIKEAKQGSSILSSILLRWLTTNYWKH